MAMYARQVTKPWVSRDAPVVMRGATTPEQVTSLGCNLGTRADSRRGARFIRIFFDKSRRPSGILLSRQDCQGVGFPLVLAVPRVDSPTSMLRVMVPAPRLVASSFRAKERDLSRAPERFESPRLP